MYEAVDRYIDLILANSTPEKPVWNIEQIRQGKKPSWNYIDGCMLISLITLYKKTDDKKYFDFVKNFVDFFVNENGEIAYYKKEEYNLDNINEGRVLFDLYDETGLEKYKKAAINLFEQIKEQPRNMYGSFWHKKIYPNQVWLDGLFMAQVFSYRFQQNFGDKDYSDVINQFKNVEKFMKDKKTGLYFHGFDATKTMFWADENGLSKNFWLRSLGWYFAALADVTGYMDDGEIKEEFKGYLKNAVDSVLKFQDKDTKMFYQVVDKGGKAGNYVETSGSALIAYAILKGVNSGLLDNSYAKFGKEIFDGICKTYLVDGGDSLELKGICLVAGLGPENKPHRDGSYEYYISEPIVSTDAKGVAPFILAYVELGKIYK